jgi:hypothetical protein
VKAYQRFSTVWQMGVAVCAFVLLSLVLESGGLMDWAQRLELGPERTAALPAAATLHRALAPWGFERQRQRGLLALARVGWSDDPVLLAEVHPKPVVAVQPEIAKPIATPQPVEPNPAPLKISRPALQPGIDPPLLSVLPEIAPVQAGKTRTIALVGDSMMAVGLSSTLLREAPKYKDLTLVKAFKSGTGLARPEVFDWQTEYPAMLGSAKPYVVIVAIGANDGQGFVVGKTVYPFGTDGWKDIYKQRVEAFLAMLEANGATVVWLGLPPMKSDVYDERIAEVNRIDYAAVNANPQAIWFSTAGIVGDAKGQFQDFGQVRGQTVRLRQADGIHLSDDGAVPIAVKLLAWLGKQVPKEQTPDANP